MPHLIDVYSRTTGLRIEKMHTYEHFFPLPSGFDDYILICSGSGMAGKNYDNFNEVIRLVAPHVSPKYKIIQVGGKDDMSLNTNLKLNGLTSTYQYFWLVKHAKLVIANDSSIIHLAGHYGVPLVAAFGPTDPKISGAWFATQGQARYLTPFFAEGVTPSFAPQEVEKSVNTIAPERIAKEALDLLGIKDCKLVETNFIGSKYLFTSVEIIPDAFVDMTPFQGQVLTLRLDYGGTEDIGMKYAAKAKCNIVTNKPLNLSKWVAVGVNIETIVYEIDESHSPSFVADMVRNGIKYLLISRLDEEKLGMVKLEYMDFDVINVRKTSQKKDIRWIKEPESFDGLRFRTHKLLIGKGNLYLSKAHYEANQPVPNGDLSKNEGDIIDNEAFWDENRFFYIYREES